MTEEFKVSLNCAARRLFDEITQFIENTAEMHMQKKNMAIRIPIFYTIGYNVLKRMALSIGHVDPLLEQMPEAIRMSVATHYPNGRQMKMPILGEFGLLVEGDHIGDTFDQQMNRFFADMADYVDSYRTMERTLPPQPQAFELVRSHLKMFATPKEAEQLETLETEMNWYLRGTVGPQVPEDYLKRDPFNV